MIQKGLEELQMMKVSIKERGVEMQRTRLLFLVDRSDKDMGYHATVANHCFQETVANLFFDTETDCC